MSVEVSAKPWEAMAKSRHARMRDIWIAEMVCGWRWIEAGRSFFIQPPERFESYKPEYVFSWEQVKEGRLDVPNDLPRYTTDAAADYLVLCRVRETWDQKRQARFSRELMYGIWFGRRERWGTNDPENCIEYRPGDYSHAAYLALQEPHP